MILTNTTRGIFVYTVLNGLIGLTVLVSGGRLEPREYDLKEYWTWKNIGQPPWYVRAIRRRRHCKEPSPTDQTSTFKPHEHGHASFVESQNGNSAKDEATIVSDLPILSRPIPEARLR